MPDTVPCGQALGDGQITATIDPDDGNANSSSLLTYAITVQAIAGGFTFQRTVDTLFRARSFSRYAYFTNHET